MSEIRSWNDLAKRVRLLESYIVSSNNSYTTVETYASLPSASSFQDNIFVVTSTTGIIGFRKLSGMWQSQETFTGSGIWEWIYLGYDRNATSIKIKYESNIDTNAFTDSDKSKLENLKEPYVHIQGIASSTWHINHMLEYKPHVTIIDNLNHEIEGFVDYIDDYNIDVSFEAAGIPVNVSGEAHLY